MNGEVTEVHKIVCVREGDLEVGCKNFKPRKFDDWNGSSMRDLHCDLDLGPPVRPSQVFRCLFVDVEYVAGIGKPALTNIPTPCSPLFLSIKHIMVPLNVSHSWYRAAMSIVTTSSTLV